MLFPQLLEKRSESVTLRDPPPWLMHAFGGMPTDAGAQVNEDSAQTLTAVWAAVRTIAGTMATFPLQVYKNLGDKGREKAADHALYKILHDKPSENLT
jgi:phage portal protein BeeE